jgi:hypothetical protein
MRSYMRAVEKYKGQASECALLAEMALGLQDKAFWLLMAEAWLCFADDAAKLAGAVAPREQISGRAA